MTVTTTANSITYAGNGTTTAFAFPHVFFAPSDLVVTLIITATGVAVVPPPVLNGAATYDFTVTGVVSSGEYASGGTVTFNTAPLATHTVSIVRAVPATQLVTLIDNTKFPAETVNVEFDKLTVLVQQALTVTSNVDTTALQIPANEVGLTVVAVPAASRAGQLLLWDGSGNLSTLNPASIIGGSVPSGPAGGDLAGTYPNPTVKTSVPIVTVFTAPGTWTPNAKLIYAVIKAVGGGGAGGSVIASAASIGLAASGGGAGSMSVKTVSKATAGASQVVTIGAAGVPGAAGTNNGGPGGDSSVGALCIGKGGAGGLGQTASGIANPAGGLGGIVGTGDETSTGAPGECGIALNNSTAGAGGGSSPWGGGGRALQSATSVTGEAASGWGAGGGGASCFNGATARAGGAGTAGKVVITEYCTP